MNFLNENRFDAIYFDMVRLFRYAESCQGYGGQIIYDLDDLLSERYAAISKVPAAHVDVMGSYRNFSAVGTIFRWPVFRSLLRLIFAYESHRCMARGAGFVR